MSARIDHLDKLLVLLSEKTGQPLDTKGLKEMSEQVGLSEKYIYEYIHRKKEKARFSGKTHINVQSPKLDVIAQYLGHKNYQAFADSIEKPIDPVLLACSGNYYSYVRRNDESGSLLRSPVRIYQQGKQVYFELTGPAWTYRGELKLKNGCLFVLMESDAVGKMIHHVYKIGVREKPPVLQGVFSGVSTTFDPIGGRTVLVRMEEDFTQLTNRQATLPEFQSSPLAFEKKIARYLSEFTTNNLRINRVVTFGIEDLDPS